MITAQVMVARATAGIHNLNTSPHDPTHTHGARPWPLPAAKTRSIRHSNHTAIESDQLHMTMFRHRAAAGQDRLNICRQQHVAHLKAHTLRPSRSSSWSPVNHHLINRLSPVTLSRIDQYGSSFATSLDASVQPGLTDKPGALPTGNGATSATKRISSVLAEAAEERIEQTIFNCRFLTLLAVLGSLAGSILCFFQGCLNVLASFCEYVFGSLHGVDTGHVVLLLVQAIDTYLMATVMLIFGMGLYELFINSIGSETKGESPPNIRKKNITSSSLFGLFRLQERPRWLEIKSLDQLKTKVGHVIVMILLVGMFEKSKKVVINSGLDLLCFAASIFMSAGCLFLLSKLHST